MLPSFIKQSEYIANYFTADLTEVIALTNFNLATELNLPSNYFRNNADIIAMLYDDIAHMLRDNLIVGIHLLLSDKDMDRSLGAYPVRYHAQYTIVPAEAGVTPNLSQPDFGRPLAPPPDVIRQTQLILLIDWNPRAQSSRSHLRRPSYNFDWVPEAARFDATTVLHYRSGSLSVDGAVVKRSEKY
ncbi:MAG TPA: hypothetical protein VGD98_10165 [Ktedonobacteraceae bacterium]